MYLNYAMRNQWVTATLCRYSRATRENGRLKSGPRLRHSDAWRNCRRYEIRPAPSYRRGRLVTNNTVCSSHSLFSPAVASVRSWALLARYRLEDQPVSLRRTYKDGQFQKPKTRASIRRSTLPTFLVKELKVWRLACPKGKHDLVFRISMDCR